MSRKHRVNKGAVLFLILIIGIISYLVSLSVMRSKDEIDIKKFCTDYLAIETQLHMLPEKYRTDSPDISAEELSACIKDMNDTVKLYFIDNENAYSYLIETLERSLTQQAGGGDVLTIFSKSIISVNITEYREDFVDVQIISQMSYSYSTDSSMAGNTIRVADNMTVQKVNGKWKVVYSHFKSPDDI